MKKAASYSRRIGQGDLLRDPDLLAEVLAFLRSTRKQFLGATPEGADPNLERTYLQLTAKVHAAIGSALSEALSAPLAPLSAGRSNIYTGIAEADGNRWFFKLTHSSLTDEYKFFSGLFTRKVPASGRYYALHAPLAILELPGFRAYVFPVIDTPSVSFDLRREPQRVREIIWALAEFNLSIGPLASGACPDFLARRTLALRTDHAERVIDVFPRQAEESGGAVHAEAVRIAESWGCVTDFAEHTVWGLSHGDLAPTNVTRADDRVLFLDMGAAGFAPLGSDLFWLLYKNRHDPEARDEIILEYRRALQELGVDVPVQEITINVYSQYCWKWLIPNELGTRSDFGHFVQVQARAAALIDEIRAYASTSELEVRVC